MRRAIIYKYINFIKNGFKRLRYQEKHKGIDKRWELFQSYLPKNKILWILDVGSNMGDTAFRCAKLGHYVLGVENNHKLIMHSIKHMPGNVAFMEKTADPQFFKDMVNVDAVFLLSVIHRMWALKGPEFAKSCMNECFKKTDLIFFEGATSLKRYSNNTDHLKLPTFHHLDVDSSIDWHINWFQECGAVDWDIKTVGVIPHTLDEPNRILFFLNSNRA